MAPRLSNARLAGEADCYSGPGSSTGTAETPAELEFNVGVLLFCDEGGNLFLGNSYVLFI